MLAFLFDPISALFFFSVSALLVVLGWKAASKRSTSLLLAYQILASFVFMGLVVMVTFGFVFTAAMIASSSNGEAPMEDIQAPDGVAPMMTLEQPRSAPIYSFRSKATVLSVFDAHVPSAVTTHLPFVRSALSSGLSMLPQKKSSQPPSTEPNMEGLPGLDGMTDEVAVDAQSDDGEFGAGAMVVTGGVIVIFLLILGCLFVLIAAVLLMSFVFFSVMPTTALLCSIFFSAACRRSLLIQRVAADHAQAAACPAVAVQVPVAVPAPAPVAGSSPAAAAPGPMMVPANMVYMPHTNMFPMAPNGFVANPYSGVIYVSGSSGEPTK